MALPKCPDSPFEYMSGSQTPAVFDRVRPLIRPPCCLRPEAKTRRSSRADGTTSAIIQISGLSSTPALSLHAATITFGCPSASALRFHMRRRTSLWAGFAVAFASAHRLDYDDKFHESSLIPNVLGSFGTSSVWFVGGLVWRSILPVVILLAIRESWLRMPSRNKSDLPSLVLPLQVAISWK